MIFKNLMTLEDLIVARKYECYAYKKEGKISATEYENIQINTTWELIRFSDSCNRKKVWNEKTAQQIDRMIEILKVHQLKDITLFII